MAESVVLSFEVDLEDSIESIESLTKANKELREERKKLNLNSVEGQKRVTEINAVLDKNTSKIKDNVSALEKQKINIGNYKSALDGVVPGLGGFAQGLEKGTSGFKALTMQALKFIATPIGAILAAIVVVFTLLKNALSQNDALMDKFENVTNAVGVVVQVVTARLAKMVEALIALVNGDWDKAVQLTGEAFGGLADEIANAVRQQQLFLDASRDLEDSQRSLRIEVAKQQNVITGLIKESKNRNLSLDEQAGKLIKAAGLEANLQKTREDIAFRDLLITARRLRSDKEFQQQSGETFDKYIERLLDSSKLAPEELDKIADKVVALEEARNSGLVLQQKIENDLAAIQLKRAEALEKQNAVLKEQTALREADRRANSEEVRSSKDGVERQDRADPLIDAFSSRAKIITSIDKRMNDDLVKRNKDADDQILSDKKKSAALQAEVERSKVAIIMDLAGSVAGLMREDSEAQRAITSAMALVNTYAAAVAAFKSGSQINVFFGVAAAAAAVAAGLANVAKINNVQFAEGGVVLKGRSHAQGGIPIEAEGDEIILTKGVYRNPQLRQMASAINVAGGGIRFADGGVAARAISNPINQAFEISNMLKNMPAPIVSVKEINRGQKSVRVKENISKR